KTGTILTKITRLTDPCSNLNHRVAMRVEMGGFIEVPLNHRVAMRVEMGGFIEVPSTRNFYFVDNTQNNVVKCGVFICQNLKSE
ncbi:MAG: hypothetical protein KGZ82_05775, partial [Bacteroidales bacterium]|nr:hypothetical protein [Bacteroidales bacterium]